MGRVDWNVVWPPDSPKLFLTECHSGLGNRLKALASFVRLAAKMPGRVPAVAWPLDGYHLHCPLGLLFDNPFLVLSPDFLRHTGYVHRLEVGKRPNFVDTASAADAVWVTEENFFWAEGDRGVVWGQHGPHRVENHALRGELLAAFASLRPHPHVLAAADDFWDNLLAGRHVVGVHVRRGDNLWANRYVPDGLFLPAVSAALDDAPPDAALFVCSDSPAAEDLLASRFGRRVFTFPKRPLDRGRHPDAAREALAEMLLLSRTRLIVRTSSSTFSQCASWLGDVPTREVGPLEHDW